MDHNDEQHAIDRDDLVTLRVSLARMAQFAGLDASIPGKPDKGADLTALTMLASTKEIGWNTLAADLMRCIIKNNSGE